MLLNLKKIDTFYINTFHFKQLFCLCFICHMDFIFLSLALSPFLFQYSPLGWDKMQEPMYHQLGTRFVEFYYNLFDNDRANLKDLYVSVPLLFLY